MKFFLCLLPLWLAAPASAQLSFSASSPDHSLKVSAEMKDGKSVLQLTSEDERMATIQLGWVVNGDTICCTGSSVPEKIHTRKRKEEKEFFLPMNKGGYGVRIRLFNDALAFRYEGHEADSACIFAEQSAWTLPKTTEVWYFERKNAWKLKSYAGWWEHCRMSELFRKASTPVQGTPVVFRLPSGQYGFISESGLENYSGLRLEADSCATLTANFTEGKSGFKVPMNFQSPWRICFVGKDLNTLVNQTVIRQLAPLPDASLFAHTDYIVPGKCAWRWFGRGTGTPEQEREVIDAAAQLGFAYALVDDGWKHWPNCWKRAEELVDYGRKKGVRLFFWQHSRDLLPKHRGDEALLLFLDSVAHIGAAGVKVDFMDSEALPLIDFEIQLLKACARRSLLVNFHGCQAPAGESFTYPNELTREGIRGLELNKMREGYLTASHNAALPFTRLAIGHGDYTPLTFTVPGQTTFAHQLATLVCFYSPLQTIAEDPMLLLNEPILRPALDFIRKVPTTWDETRVLEPSEIGRLAILARRKGKDWYIGVLNGEEKPRRIALDLSPFLKRGAVLQGFTDDLTAEKVLLPMDGLRPAALKRPPAVPFKAVKQRKPLETLDLAPSGGAVIVIHHP